MTTSVLESAIASWWRILILLSDMRNRCNALEYSSKMSRRIFRTIIGVETFANLDAFNAAYAVALNLRLALARTLKMVMFTDSKQLFGALVRGMMTTKRRLTVDIASACDSYCFFETGCVGLVKRSDNLADGLTNVSGNGALEQVLHSKRIIAVVGQLVERTIKPSSK